MSCVSPTIIYKNGSVVDVPCRHCAQCIASRVADLSFLAEKELEYCYKRGLGASFVTLTYSSEHLPFSPRGFLTVRKSDLVNFHKRLRINLERDNIPIKYKHISCLEYGDENGRPHMHSVIIGLSDALAQKYISWSWSIDNFGLIDVQPLRGFSGVRYVCKYMSKSNPFGYVKQIYKFAGSESPKVLHSVGIGRDWLNDNLYNILKSEFCYYKRGKKMLYPKSVRQYVQKQLGVDPRPYVDKYIQSINTHGLSLDDFQAQQSYYNEMIAYNNNISSFHASAFPSQIRRPIELRPFGSSVSVSELVSIC